MKIRSLSQSAREGSARIREYIRIYKGSSVYNLPFALVGPWLKVVHLGQNELSLLLVRS